MSLGDAGPPLWMLVGSSVVFLQEPGRDKQSGTQFLLFISVTDQR